MQINVTMTESEIREACYTWLRARGLCLEAGAKFISIGETPQLTGTCELLKDVLARGDEG